MLLAMGQGIAAVIAAGVGLVGAIAGAAVGGVAASRGARVGAETSARATAEQVRDQAAMDHEHWLRGQRLEACSALLAAYHEYAITVSNVTRALDGVGLASAELGEALGQSVTNVRNAYLQVRLVGPAKVREQALLLRRGVEDHDGCVHEWIDAFLALDVPKAAAAEGEEEQLRCRLGDLHDAFVEAATDSMARPPTEQLSDYVSASVTGN